MISLLLCARLIAHVIGLTANSSPAFQALHATMRIAVAKAKIMARKQSGLFFPYRQKQRWNHEALGAVQASCQLIRSA